MQGLNGTALTLEVIQKARELAVACGDSHIDTGYVLWAILERPHSREACTLEALGVGHRKVKRWLQSFRGSAPKKKGGDPLPATAATEEVFLRAIEEARASAGALGNDGYGYMIRSLIARLDDAVANDA